MNYHHEMALEALIALLPVAERYAETQAELRLIDVAKCAIAMQEVASCDAYIRAEHAKLVEALQ